jgi:hypothetical protein
LDGEAEEVDQYIQKVVHLVKDSLAEENPVMLWQAELLQAKVKVKKNKVFHAANQFLFLVRSNDLVLHAENVHGKRGYQGVGEAGDSWQLGVDRLSQAVESQRERG